MSKYLFILLIYCINLMATETLKMVSYKTSEFSPTLNQKFEIKFKLNSEANVSLNIFTPDYNLIQIINKNNLQKGNQTFIWDGKDLNNKIVPNEAYSIMIKVKTKKSTEIFDYRYTEGEILDDIKRKVDRNGNITYSLLEPARVLIRAGIHNSAMIKEILHWKPKNKGLVREKWNLKDKDKLINVKEKNFAISVSAFKLPKYSILVQNNNNITYSQYFKNRNFKCSKNLISIDNNIKIRISKHVNNCKAKSREPKLYIDILSSHENNIPILRNNKSSYIKVKMDAEDEEYFSKLKYEVSFFIDFEFSSEEEMGYMPIGWNFMPNGLKKGKHILTVNVSSFTGQVGVKHLIFIIK